MIKCIYCGSENVKWWKMKGEETNSSFMNKCMIIRCESLKCAGFGKLSVIEQSDNVVQVYEMRKIVSGNLK